MKPENIQVSFWREFDIFRLVEKWVICQVICSMKVLFGREIKKLADLICA